MNVNPMKFPKVGDRLVHTMSIPTFGMETIGPEPCIVVYANKPNNYYTVEFCTTGIRESYKVPRIDEIDIFKGEYERAFGRKPKGYYIWESGAIYPTMKECAKNIGVSTAAISKHIHGHTSNVKGYHIHVL